MLVDIILIEKGVYLATLTDKIVIKLLDIHFKKFPHSLVQNRMKLVILVVPGLDNICLFPQSYIN